MKHFLQTQPWAAFQQKMGRTIISDTGNGWSYIAILEKGKLNSRLYVPYGPTLETNAALSPALSSLKQKAIEHGATFIRIEPIHVVTAKDLLHAGLKKVSPIQPDATSIIDLYRSEEEIIAAMTSNTRNLYRNYKQKGIHIRQSFNSREIDTLLMLLSDVAKHTGMNPQSNEYLRKQAESLISSDDASLYFAEHGDTVIASALVYDSNDTRYYAHAAADYEHRGLNAGTALVSQMIIDAKRKGLKYFDLYGIWIESEKGSTKSGITRFKRSFGGQDKQYVGTWEYPVRHVNYAMYRFMAKWYKRLR